MNICTCHSTPTPRVPPCLCPIPYLHFIFSQREPWLSATSTHLLHLLNPTGHKQKEKSSFRIAILIALWKRSLRNIVQGLLAVLFLPGLKVFIKALCSQVTCITSSLTCPPAPQHGSIFQLGSYVYLFAFSFRVLSEAYWFNCTFEYVQH